MSGDFALDLRGTGKRLVPARFEFAGHQAVRRVGRIVLAEGAIGRVTRGLEIAQKSRPHLVPPLACFLLGRDGGCDGTGTDNTAATRNRLRMSATMASIDMPAWPPWPIISCGDRAASPAGAACPAWPPAASVAGSGW